VLNLIDHLPRDSALLEALADDDEVAALLPEPAGPAAPRLSEWSTTVDLLAALHDRQSEILAALVALGGKRPPKPQLWPRPVTARQRVAHRRRVQAHHDLVRRVLPSPGGDPA
jgi:hypothetical protein